jgi:uncharacterized RDD family membrane protein YckC
MIDTRADLELSLRAGQIFGEYRIVRALGQGGMGEVFEAVHVASDRRVALKVMRHHLGPETDRKRFLREGRLAASVSHPNTVYIYGSEEIDDRPVIVMELVRQGTLKDRVDSSGPLPVGEAVDAMLQVLAGLEAAQANGVLHRDVKPANCFVDADGSIKIGDFGLSISTHARPESMLTTAGMLMGTPSFASPEQLRGDQLDVRADIYSVGATLYYLLTGFPPHRGETLVQLVAQALNDAPKPAHELRREVPHGLSRVILRCLAKQPGARYTDYRALRAALLPYSSRSTPPATLAFRFSAALIDAAVLALPLFFVTGTWDGYDSVLARTTTAIVGFLIMACWNIAYYGITEGIWGMSLGKAIMGLRVVGPDGGAPGMARASARAALYWSSEGLPPLLLLPFVSAAEFGTDPDGSGNVSLVLNLAITAVLLATMRRRNGFAALHDLLTRTRVTSRFVLDDRPVMETVHALPAVTAVSARESFGPYIAVASLTQHADHELLLGEDEVLRRRVWIVRYPSDRAPTTETRRAIARLGRLRWLQGERSPVRSYDVFEYAEGMPLLALVDRPHRWSELRGWLEDLTLEIGAQEKEPASAVAFGLDRIWITRTGRALLLDFPAPHLPPSITVAPATLPAGMADVAPHFDRLASLVIEGHNANDEARRHTVVPLPMHAREILNSIRQYSAQSSADLLARLRAATGRLSTISSARRLATMAFMPALLGTFGLFVWWEGQSFDRKWSTEYPQLASLRRVVDLRVGAAYEMGRAAGRATSRAPSDSAAVKASGTSNSADDRNRAVDIYIATHYRDIVSAPNFWAEKRSLAVERSAIDSALARYTAPSASDSVAAAQRVEALLAKRRIGVAAAIGRGALIVLVVMAVTSLIGQIASGRVLGLRMFGITVVNRAGQRASRFRLVVRWVLAWVPILVALLLLVMVTPADSDNGNVVYMIGPLAIVAAGLVWSLLRPQRGLHDRLAGTWLVPR